MRYLFLFFTVLLAFIPHLIAQQKDIQEKLDELSHLGTKYKYLDETTIELSDSLTGYRSIKTIEETNTQEIYNWARSKDIPVIDFDPVQIDTNKWDGWYEYWTFVIVSNAEHRIPTKSADFDGNGFAEIYGIFAGVGFLPEFRIWEVYLDGSSLQRYQNNNYQAGLSLYIGDIDKNGLSEVVYQHGQNNYVYEQTDTNTLPTELKYIFTKYDGFGGYLSREIFENIDGDSLLDFVHRGSDTSLTEVYNFYVSEYNPTINNFEKKWFFAPTDDFYDGFDVGDYDGDGKMEFILSSIRGQIRIIENKSNDNYEVTVFDSLPLVNMYYQVSGDVDKDGKSEFFIGATMGDGNWTVMFETDGDNHYTPRVVLHLVSGGSLDDPTYIVDDINGDGELELALLSGGYLYIFKSDGDNSYYLWYLKKGPSSFSFNFADMNGDGTKDILWSSIQTERWATDIYKATDLVGIESEEYIIPDKFELSQNYPNPFNPVTTIFYNLPFTSNVQINVFDVLGRQVAKLINEEKSTGSYNVQFDGSRLSSGLYVYQLRTEFGSISKKMLLIK